MKKIFFVFMCCFLLVSCRQVDYVSSGTYLLDNRSSYDVVVVFHHKAREEADTSKLIQVGMLDTIYHIVTDPSYHTPWMLKYMKIFRCAENTEMTLLYEQNPIDESLWTVERQYKKGEYGHTVNTFVFTDDMVRR